MTLTASAFRYFVLLTAASLFCCSGCQRLPDAPEGMGELTPCVIEVTFGGEKIDGVAVQLQPKVSQNTSSNATRMSAGGQTDENGKAILKTAGYYDGVQPGEYTISFQKYAPEEMRADGMPLPAKTLIPLQYASGRSKETILVSKTQKEYVFQLDTLPKKQ